MSSLWLKASCNMKPQLLVFVHTDQAFVNRHAWTDGFAAFEPGLGRGGGLYQFSMGLRPWGL